MFPKSLHVTLLHEALGRSGTTRISVFRLKANVNSLFLPAELIMSLIAPHSLLR